MFTGLIANKLMSHLERRILRNCPITFKPKLYKRFMDDTFVLFENTNQAILFLNYINSFHPNIQFTMEHEQNNLLPFLDVLVERKPEYKTYCTSVYRKPTFTGLGLNFYSYCDKKFKENSCTTLINRSYKISSNYIAFHNEIETLRKYFKENKFNEKSI